METETTERESQQVLVGRDIWKRLKIAAAEQETTVREIVERAVLKELDGRKK